MPETKEQVAKPTPGPWEVREVIDDDVIISRGVRQVGGRGINQGVDIEMFSEADARLIAAAPDLLAALKQVLEHVEDPTVDRVPEWCCTLCATYRGIARDAISKAEGH
jgi:hypothetical protein